MKNKIKNLLGSIRFWGVTFIAALALTKQISMTGFSIDGLIVIVQCWMGAVVSIGTLDSVATKFGISFIPPKK